MLSAATHLEVGQHQAAGGRDGRSGQRPSDSVGRHKLDDVRRQPERHRPTGVQLAGRVVHVELEVGHVQHARVLVQVHHVRIEAGQMEGVLADADQSELQRELR